MLLGHHQPPIDNGTMTLMEVANAYYSRALAIQMAIQRAEADGTVLKGTGPYKFRTGELRSFIELAKGAAELGSRRVTYEKNVFDQTRPDWG